MEWKIDAKVIDYQESLALMKERVRGVIDGSGDELIWMLQYEPLYTGGSSASPGDLLNSNLFPIFHVGRGGKYTYHGPGQRVVYLILDLKRRNMCDLRKYIGSLEEMIICILANFGISGYRRKEYIGVWVETKCGEQRKIAAIGIRISKWVSYHGIAVNLYPNLDHYSAIVPCGIKDFGVTSVEEMGVKVKDFDAFDKYFKKAFIETFGEL